MARKHDALRDEKSSAESKSWLEKKQCKNPGNKATILGIKNMARLLATSQKLSWDE